MAASVRMSPHISGSLGQVGVDDPERESHPLECLHGVLVRDVVSGVDDADPLAPINSECCPQNINTCSAFVPSYRWFALDMGQFTSILYLDFVSYLKSTMSISNIKTCPCYQFPCPGHERFSFLNWNISKVIRQQNPFVLYPGSFLKGKA